MPRFAVPVDANAVATLVVEERRPNDTSYAIASLTDQQIAVFVRDSRDDRRIGQALIPIQDKKREDHAALQRRVRTAIRKADRIGEEQQRLRENIGVLKGSSGEQQLLKRYLSQLNEQEDRIAALRVEMSELQQKLSAANKELVGLIETLALDLDVVETDL